MLKISVVAIFFAALKNKKIALKRLVDKHRCDRRKDERKIKFIRYF